MTSRRPRLRCRQTPPTSAADEQHPRVGRGTQTLRRALGSGTISSRSASSSHGSYGGSSRAPPEDAASVASAALTPAPAPPTSATSTVSIHAVIPQTCTRVSSSATRSHHPRAARGVRDSQRASCAGRAGPPRCRNRRTSSARARRGRARSPARPARSGTAAARPRRRPARPVASRPGTTRPARGARRSPGTTARVSGRPSASPRCSARPWSGAAVGHDLGHRRRHLVASPAVVETIRGQLEPEPARAGDREVAAVLDAQGRGEQGEVGAPVRAGRRASSAPVRRPRRASPLCAEPAPRALASGWVVLQAPRQGRCPGRAQVPAPGHTRPVALQRDVMAPPW